jgi:hypothetical protein
MSHVSPFSGLAKPGRPTSSFAGTTTRLLPLDDAPSFHDSNAQCRYVPRIVDEAAIDALITKWGSDRLARLSTATPAPAFVGPRRRILAINIAQ